MTDFRLPLSLAVLSLLCATSAPAQTAPLAGGPLAAAVEDGTIDETLLDEDSPEVRAYDALIQFLADPALEGRLPGTPGMEKASVFVEDHYAKAGLVRPYADGTSYRQAFDLGTHREVIGAGLGVGGTALSPDVEFAVSGHGEAGKVQGEVVFCGYGIDRGKSGYRGYPEDVDLTGKVALIFRFEPMDESGRSLWSTRAGWSSRAGLSSKMRAAAKRGAAAVILVNPPGADDERIHELVQGTRAYVEVPVLSLLPESGRRLLELGGVSESLMDLRREADAAGVVRELGFSVDLEAAFEETPILAENVIGLLPGRGNLAEEYVVVGAHLDHLGMGNFGSRSGPGKIHPGADDNASGSAGVVMLAQALADEYERLPDDAHLRSILFMCFSAEESGLNGSAHYTRSPLVPIEQHKLMINFDMIGRVTEKRLSVSGATTGEGFGEWLEPFFAASPLEIVQPERMSGASDHTPFYRAGMPVLFGIIADFHDDYHTPEDVVEKINRIDAVYTVQLFHDILLAAAQRPELFAHIDARTAAARAMEANADKDEDEEPEEPRRPRVRLGVSLQDDGEGPGLRVTDVHEGSAAHKAGMQAGDRLTHWGEVEVDGWSKLQELLGGQEPGDRVQVKVRREGDEKVLDVELAAAGR